MAPLSIADVERIAALAHLNLSDDEKTLFARQLADILHYAEQVQAVDTTGVAATAHVLALVDAERPDEPAPVAHAAGGHRQRARTPNREAGLFRVPRVIGG